MSLRTKRLAACTAALMTAGAFTAFSAAPSSAAATMSYLYDCQTGVGPQTDVPVDVSTDIPDVLLPGQTITPTISSTVVMPASVPNTLWFYGHRRGLGTAVATTVVNGDATPVNLTIPNTPLVYDAPLTVVATGQAPAFTAGADGETVTINTGSFTSDLTFYKDETTDFPASQSVSCDLAAGQNPLVQVVQVKEAVPTVAAPAAITLGDATTLNVSVAPVANGVASVVVGSQTLTGTVTNGTGTIAVPANSLAVGTHSLTVSFLRDGQATPKTTTTSLTVNAVPVVNPPVVKTAAKVTVKAPKAVKRGKVATFKVTVGSSTTPTGKVTVTIAGAKKTVTLKNGKATVKVKVKKKAKAGKTKATIAYTGDAAVNPGSKTVKVKIKK